MTHHGPWIGHKEAALLILLGSLLVAVFLVAWAWFHFLFTVITYIRTGMSRD